MIRLIRRRLRMQANDRGSIILALLGVLVMTSVVTVGFASVVMGHSAIGRTIGTKVRDGLKSSARSSLMRLFRYRQRRSMTIDDISGVVTADVNRL